MSTGLKEKTEINLESTDRRQTSGTVSRNDFAHLEGLSAIGVAELRPVLGLGSHSGDYHGSADPNSPEQHIINVPLPAGSRII